MSKQLKKGIARNKRIVAYILRQYQVNEHYDLPLTVDQFVSALQRDIDKAETWLGSQKQK